MKKLRWKLVVVLLFITCILSIPSISSYAVDAEFNLTIQEATHYVNSFESDDITYSVSAMKPLFSITDPSCYQYALCELNPYGYVVMNKDGYIMEGWFSEGVTSPISALSTEEYYYIGVSSFAEKKGNLFYPLNSNIPLSPEQIQAVAQMESRFLSNKISTKSINTRSLSPMATAAETTVKVRASYFENLTTSEFPTNTGDCVLVAIAMMFEYYDTYVNDDYVPSAYSPNTLKSVLHEYVQARDEVYTNLMSVAFAMDDYLGMQDLPVWYNYGAYNSNDTDTRWLLDDDRVPVVAYKGYNANGEFRHAAIAYGYKESNGTLTHYYIHNGWSGTSAAYNIGTISHSMVEQFSYIYDCMDSGEHDYTIRQTARNYHSGNYHYYQYEYDCNYCTDSYYTYIGGTCPGGCIELMGNPGEVN